ncbi:MAG: formate dehydrogenase subunit gamma [Acidobacteriota bacterium]|nr:formate dehydrogenase subunit gamma [Acidobacteriota bacterium]
MNAHTWDTELARKQIEDLATVPGPLLPILHSLQEKFGYIDESAIPLIARALNISQAEVHGTISFYHDFRRERPGRHLLKICRAEACQSLGCDRLIGHIQTRLGTPLGQTTRDGSITFEQIFCLGLCAMSPALMLDGKPFARVTTQIADSLIDSIRRQV